MAATENDLQHNLLSFYRATFPAQKDLQISSLTEISDGWETEVFRFTLTDEAAGARNLILRLYSGDNGPEKANKEFKGMKQLQAVGYPVPEVVMHLGPDKVILGKPFIIMAQIEGRSLEAAFIEALAGSEASEASPEKPGAFFTQFCQLFVDLHALDWRLFVPDPTPYQTGDPYVIINEILLRFQQSLNYFQKDEFQPVLDWLVARPFDVPCTQPAVTHRDYHPLNILLDAAGQPFVIDWTGIGVTDFRLDLAWTLLLMSTHGEPAFRDIILTEYERLAGGRIEQIDYFEVLAILRRLVDVSVSLSAGAAKMGMRPGAEHLMQQQAGALNRVYALLQTRTDIEVPEVKRLLETFTVHGS